MNSVNLVTERKNTITVKIVAMGKGITHYVGEDAVTLGRLLEELGVDGREDVRVNGTTVEKTYRLANADEVVILPKIRGGAR